MKNLLSIIILLLGCHSFAQSNDVPIHYYHNHKKQKINNLEVFMFYENDTILLATRKNKIVLPKTDGRFGLKINVNDQQFLTNPKTPNENQNYVAIVLGKITDTKKLKKSPTHSNFYIYRKNYLLPIENIDTVAELNFIVLTKKEVTSATAYRLRSNASVEIIKPN
ncbi:hypothetical protein ACFS5J_12110 [Flavobacterium chuncheonense]|uniref:Uncharacterized protein n=1 Tax=Flavobacterium chuncheonense TaxID=2026653 RepID=A0ABW5YNW5_9FLAO